MLRLVKLTRRAKTASLPPPAASPRGRPRCAGGSPAALPVAGTGSQPAQWGADQLWRGCWHPRATGRLRRRHGAEVLAISAGPLQAETVLGDGIAAASASPPRPACEPTRRQGLLRGYRHRARDPEVSPAQQDHQTPELRCSTPMGMSWGQTDGCIRPLPSKPGDNTQCFMLRKAPDTDR